MLFRLSNVINSNAVTNGSCWTQSLFSATLQYIRGCFFLTLWIVLRAIALVSCIFQKNEIWIRSWMRMATGTSLQCVSRGKPGSPHQDACFLPRAAAFPIFFTASYSVCASWLVFRRVLCLCSGNPRWQMCSFVSARRVAAMVWPC